MLKGTRILEGVEATQYVAIVDSLRNACKNVGYEEVIFPSLYEVEPFIEKGGEEIVGQLWNFKDKGDRDVTLIPEVTALVQERWRDHWSKNSSSKRIFYVNRCYRYERPQQGRYREFTQFGIELLGKPKEFFDCFTDNLGIEFDYNDNVVRGLGYYVDNGFEVEAKWLGAQKQVAGGGAYAEGVGFAIGVDRLMLALTAAQSTNKLELVK
jgi:histidyl-tRNA synthetase